MSFLHARTSSHPQHVTVQQGRLPRQRMEEPALSPLLSSADVGSPPRSDPVPWSHLRSLPSPKRLANSPGEGPPPPGETHGWAEGQHSSAAMPGKALPGNRGMEAENAGPERDPLL